MRDVLAVVDPARGQPGGHLGLEGRAVGGEFADDEAAQGEAAGQHQSHQRGKAVRAFGRGDGVVAGDGAADRDAGEGVEKLEDGREDLAPGEFEIDVDAIGAGGDHAPGKVGLVAVKAGLEAERFGGVAAFLCAPRHADHAEALQAGDLAHHAADRPGRGTDHEGLTRGRPADVLQPRPGGKAGHPEDAKPGLHRRGGRVEFPAVRGPGDGVVAPGVVDQHLIAGVERGVVRLKDAGHRLGRGRVAKRCGRGVGPGLGHPAAHVGVEREPFHPEKDLTGAGVRERDLDTAEVLAGWHSDGAAGKLDGAGGRHGDPPFAGSCAVGRGLESCASGHARLGAP